MELIEDTGLMLFGDLARRCGSPLRVCTGLGRPESVRPRSPVGLVDAAGKGSTFQITLPIRGEFGKLILVVDDQEDLRGVLRDLLTVTRLPKPRTAKPVWLKLAPSTPIILMDIQLPVMDGNEATRQIKADPALGPSSVRRRDHVLPGIRPGPLASGAHVGREDRHRVTP
jgi:hypothetical protein